MVFVWFGSQGNISLIKWVKNYFLPIFCKKLCIIQCLTELFSDTEFGYFFLIKTSVFFIDIMTSALSGPCSEERWGETAGAHSEVWGQTAGASRALCLCTEVGSCIWQLGSSEVQGAVLSGLSKPTCPSLLRLHFSTLSSYHQEDRTAPRPLLIPL